MGFLDRLFSKPPYDSKDQPPLMKDNKNQSQHSFMEKLEKSIQEMDASDKERMIDMIVRGESSLDFSGPIKTDPLLLDSARLIIQKQQSSASLIQRTFSVGYARSGRIIDQLEELGIIGPFLGDSPRKVYFKTLSDLDNFLQQNPSLKTKTEVFYSKHKEIIDLKKAEFLKNQAIEEDLLEKEVIKQQLIEKERKKRLHKEALQELIESGEIFNSFINKNGNREPIPQDVMDKVWNRDGGKCVKCGSQENLEFDHLIPVSKGGATTYRNMQLLCKKCNIEKSNIIG